MSDFMKTPCKDCPFRIDKKPFLHPNRATEIAYSAQNPYNSFSCHKTLGYDEDRDGTCVTSESKECAGFMTLQACENGKHPQDFIPSYELVYDSSLAMMQAYEKAWEGR
jgi:hypothetical protein